MCVGTKRLLGCGLFLLMSNLMMRANVETAPGWPSRDPQLDALPGFQTPPVGYGEVPFWWWTGEPLDVDRLIWQVRELYKKGISGVQVNYSHLDTPGWPTDFDEPAIFSEQWWEIYSRVSEECGKLDMGIGLSTYTLDWPRGGQNLFLDLFYSKPDLNAYEIHGSEYRRLAKGESLQVIPSADTVAVRAYQVQEGQLQQGGVDLGALANGGAIEWTAPSGEWSVWVFESKRKEGSLNPLLPESGALVVRDFFQEFEDHNPGKTSKGLNYFFNDELHLGADKYAWHQDFATQFKLRKGYDLFEVLPAMWIDIGDLTPKVLMDYADVRMSLMEERYFKPIYDWHASRGIIFGCDSEGRGTKPYEFGDYFRATRWYTAPGHDTPGGNADLIKGKVSSSVANLYQQPRVWLEGYHSMGWGATPEQLMFATRENYLYGCTLLNLHGLYYTTYGSHWEWAPPCYHFHMPYWAHMSEFLGYFDRLSYLMSQGHHVADVAVVYPVAPYTAEMDGEAARTTAFELAQQLMGAGINFDFIDSDSLARAVVREDRLVVEDANASYQALVFPNMDAVRWGSIEKAAQFAQAGGHVVAVGTLPQVSDRVGRNDPELAALNALAFDVKDRMSDCAQAVARIQNAFMPDVLGKGMTVRALHRRVGFRDVYLVMDAEPGTIVEFRAKGAVELWDPWTGETKPLRVHEVSEHGTEVELPLEAHEAQVVVFTPEKVHQNPNVSKARLQTTLSLEGEWTVAFEPTMDNRYGDFRLPVTELNQMIGVEARRFAWARETPELRETAMLPDTDDSTWQSQLHGFGAKFYRLGPIPEDFDSSEIDAELAQLEMVDPAVPVSINGHDYYWQPYEFSWRFGKEGDPGHQGFHGLKGKISEHFIRLGHMDRRSNGITLLKPEAHQRYYLWTAARTNEAVSAQLSVSEATAATLPNTSPVNAPAAIFINGAHVTDLSATVALHAGANPVLLRYDDFGQSHVVLRRLAYAQEAQQLPLAMPWYQDAGVIPLDVSSDPAVAEWYRFRTAPGTRAIQFEAHSQGPVEVWIDGVPMMHQGNGQYVAVEPIDEAAVVAIRLVPKVGCSGGAAIPKPVLIETGGEGRMPLGDWSEMGVLNHYSGGVRYRKEVTLGSLQPGELATLDLGRVSATAEVFVNGKSIGVRVASPWTFDLTDAVQPGTNTIEVLVYNTLSNHYQTIPSSYRGDPVSGLLGPVRLFIEACSGGDD